MDRPQRSNSCTTWHITLVQFFFKEHEAGGDDGPIAGLFWTYSWAVGQWKRHPEVLSFDNTYKTNKFNMPLLQVTGVTGSWTTFSVGWALLGDETEASFSWAISQIQKVAADERISPPYVAISDYDRAFRNAFQGLIQKSHSNCADGT